MLTLRFEVLAGGSPCQIGNSVIVLSVVSAFKTRKATNETSGSALEKGWKSILAGLSFAYERLVRCLARLLLERVELKANRALAGFLKLANGIKEFKKWRLAKRLSESTWEQPIRWLP
jgi:hypothetical protein